MKKKVKIAMIIGALTPLLIVTGLSAIFSQTSFTTDPFDMLKTDLTLADSPKIQNCLTEPRLLKHTAAFTYKEVNKVPVEYLFVVSTYGDSDNISLHVFIKDGCENVSLSYSNPWSDQMPKEVAIAFKAEWYKYLKNLNADQFTMMVSKPRTPATSFYKEDIEALAMIGVTLGSEIRVFDGKEDYQRMLAEEDPFFLKDHPSLKRNQNNN